MSNIGMESGHASAEPSKAVLEKAAEWIVRLNDPAVTEGDFIAWQAWLGESPAHAQAFQECQDTWNRSASVLQLSPVVPSGMQGMRTELAAVLERSMRRRKTGLRWLAIAATIVVASVGVVIWRASSSVVETATAELRSVRLPDGSRAALGPETRLEIDFSERSRSLTMTSGEAYFEVVHAPERPFSVDTPAGRVIAVGTAFSVNASPDRVAVAVAQGVVRVDSPGNADPTASTVVSAGHRFIRDHAHTNIETLASPADAVAWQAGSLEYQGEPLRVVVADINRYSAIKVRVADAALGDLRYTGTVFPDALDAWLTSIEGVFPVRIERNGDHDLIVRAQPPDRAER